jgi:hypothetical protein
MHRVVIFVGLAGAVACGSPSPKTASAVAGLPEYTPEEATLFGDTLSPTLFGLPKRDEGSSNLKLADRSRGADAVIPARVSTITRESLAGAQAFVLVLTPDGPPVVGQTPKDPLEFRIHQGGSMARVQAEDSKLVGMRLLVFVKRYSEAGEPTYHFHGESDTPAIRGDVKSAKRLDAPGPKVQTEP